MAREPTVEQLAKQMGRLQEQMLKIAQHSHQTAIKDRKAAVPLPKAPKRPIPEHLKKYAFKKKGK